MEVIGTASALAHLLELSIKASKAAKSLVQSFLNAPEELVQLATKLDHLRSRIEQLHRLEEELPVSNSLVLLPPEHQTILSSGLQTNLDALQAIRSLCYTRSGASQTVQARLRWATLDKKRTDQILGRVAKAESQLNTVLVILGMCASFFLEFDEFLPIHLPFDCQAFLIDRRVLRDVSDVVADD